MSLPPAKRPKQKPIRKLEASGDIVLGYFPEFSGKKDDARALVREATRSLIRAADRSKSEEDLHIETEHILRNFFSSTGHDYDPHHNVTVIRGRPDTLYGRVLIQYKKPKTLASRAKSKKATEEVQDTIKERALKDNDEL